MTEPITGAGVVFCAAGKVLLMCRPDGTWGIPAGKIEPGETPQQAALREVLEETGFTITDPEFAAGVPMKVVNNSDGVTFYAYSQDLDAPFVPVINEEHMACGWFPVELLPAPLFECTAELIAMAVACAAMDRAEESSRLLDANGWYEIRKNPISKVGVYPYLGKHIPGADPNVMYNVYRPAEELSNPETIASFRLLPWINDHTMLGNRKGATPAEQKPIEGVLGQDIVFEGDTLYGNLKLFSGQHGVVIDSGKSELSSGYRCKYEHAPGVFNGQPYEYVQRQIRGNHVASVDDGRMGPEVSVLDSLSLSFTFDAKDLQIMATEDTTKGAGPGEGGAADKEMTISELAALVKSIMPQITAMNEALAALKAPVTDPTVAVEDKTPDASTLAAATDAAVTAGKEAGTAAGMDAADKVLKSFIARDKLAARLSEQVGAFDAKDKTLGEVVAYGIDKLKITAPAGQEAVYLQAYLDLTPAPSRARVARLQTADVGDSADRAAMPDELAKYING